MSTTTTDYLQALINQKKALANNLVKKNVEASEDEKFNTLVSKVLDIDVENIHSFTWQCCYRTMPGNYTSKRESVTVDTHYLVVDFSNVDDLPYYINTYGNNNPIYSISSSQSDSVSAIYFTNSRDSTYAVYRFNHSSKHVTWETGTYGEPYVIYNLRILQTATFEEKKKTIEWFRNNGAIVDVVYVKDVENSAQ